jgi:hypothetical protein
MSVTPSPIGGFAGQFFDNNGNPLSGGKIFTYAAGTTTPQAAYTSASGVTPHSNPIVLDSAGRVPGGEIWLTDGLVYKFVIETATSILIGTYDNITGVNSNFVNYTVQEEVITATAGQTVFNLSTINYTPGTNSLTVYIDGVNQYVGDSYLETDSDTVTFTAGLHVGAEVKFTTAVQTTTGSVAASIVTFTGFKSQTGSVQDLAGDDGADWIGFEQAGTGSVARSAQDKLRDTVSVKDFGAVGDGVADDTAAINDAIAYVKSLSTGGCVYFPDGVYAVTEIDASSSTADFTKSIILKGAGRLATTIIPYSAGNVLLNMMGSNNMLVEGVTFRSAAVVSQTAIFMARTTTSTNCNNNKFRDVYTEGNYSVASVACNGSESSNWFNCRFENSYAAADHRCLWSGGGTLVGGLQGVTTVNGGVVLNSGNPNTNNMMFGCEFYAPYNNANLVRFSTATNYSMHGCTLVGGSVNNVKLVKYGDVSGGRFNGPITWYGCQFEVFGTDNVIHYLDTNSNPVFDGISNYGGYYVVSNGTSVIDFDRVNYLAQPTLQSSVWTNFTTSPNSSNTKAYVYALQSCQISFSPNPNDGYFYVFGFVEKSATYATYLFVGTTRFLSCTYTTTATALPTAGTYTVGTTIQLETPVIGQPTGWKCTDSGTLGTLNGGATTGNITLNSNQLTVSSTTDLTEGQRVTVAGAGGPFYVRKLSGTTAYLDGVGTATVTGAAVGFYNATLAAMANL